MSGDLFLGIMCLISFALFAAGTIGIALIRAFEDIDPGIPQVDVPSWDRETLGRETESEES